MGCLLICCTFLFVLFNIVSSGVDPSKFPEYFNADLWLNDAYKYEPLNSIPCGQNFLHESSGLKTEGHCALSGTARNLALWYCMKKCEMKNCNYWKIGCQIYHDYEERHEYLRIYCECTGARSKNCVSKGLTLDWKDAETDFESDCWDGRTVLTPRITASTLSPAPGPGSIPQVWNQSYFTNATFQKYKSLFTKKAMSRKCSDLYSTLTADLQFEGSYCTDTTPEHSVVSRLICAGFCKSCAATKVTCDAPSFHRESSKPEEIVVKCSCETKNIFGRLYQCAVNHFSWDIMQDTFLKLCTETNELKCSLYNGIWHERGSCFIISQTRALDFEAAKTACKWPYIGKANFDTLNSLVQSLGFDHQLFAPVGQLAFVQERELVYKKFQFSSKIENDQCYWVGLKHMDNSAAAGQPNWGWVTSDGYEIVTRCDHSFWGRGQTPCAMNDELKNTCGCYTKEGVPGIKYSPCSEKKRYICEYRAEIDVDFRLVTTFFDSHDKIYEIDRGGNREQSDCLNWCRDNHLCLAVRFVPHNNDCTIYDHHSDEVIDWTKESTEELQIYDKIRFHY